MQLTVRLIGTPTLGIRFDDGTEIEANNYLQSEIFFMSESEGKALEDIHTPEELAHVIGQYWSKKARSYARMAKEIPPLLVELAQASRQ